MKTALKSRTLWFNVITAFVAAFQGPLGTSIPAEYLVVILAGGNFVLRFLTTTAVK